MTDSNSLISAILKARSIDQVLDVSRLEDEFKAIRRLIHPDVCPHTDAGAAFQKLYDLKERWEKGTLFTDESGEFRTNGHFIKFTGDRSLLEQSVRNYQLLRAVRKTGFKHEHFHRYMPQSMIMTTEGLEVSLPQRAVPLTDMQLEQKHVNWLLSRILEFAALCYQAGFTHIGLNPESIFVVPETHGIQVVSFYHLTHLNTRVNTICGRYMNWYPPSLFKEKRALPLIDIELAKKTAIYLLGDTSGSGVKLRKTCNADFMNFVISQHTDVLDAYQKYRDLLAVNFKKEFYPLEI